MPKRTLPNIVLICTDQQRYDAVGCYGNVHIKTPTLDTLASNGTVYENCYSQSPVCSPARATLFTGLYPRNHGLWANGVALSGHHKLLSRVLADAGYDCGMVGKQHLSPCQDWRMERRLDDGYRVFEWAHDPIHRSPQNRYHHWLWANFPDLARELLAEPAGVVTSEMGNEARGPLPFDTAPVEAHYSHWVADQTVEFIRSPRAAEQPYFVIANFFDPHHPFGAPEKYMRLYDPDQLPRPVTSDDELQGKPALLADASKRSYAGSAPGFQEYSAEEIQRLRAAYYAMVSLVDDETRRILDAVDDTGLRDDTLVVFTSDHGEMLGDHQLLLKGPMMYDCAVKVPLIIRWPGRVEAGARCRELVQTVDLASTFMEATGLSGMPWAQGQSLLNLSADPTAPWRDWAIAEYRNSGHPYDPAVHTTMLRSGQHKLVVWHGDVDGARHHEGELYDLESDPQELNNLYYDVAHRDTRQELSDKLLDVLVATEDRRGRREALW